MRQVHGSLFNNPSKPNMYVHPNWCSITRVNYIYMYTLIGVRKTTHRSTSQFVYKKAHAYNKHVNGGVSYLVPQSVSRSDPHRGVVRVLALHTRATVIRFDTSGNNKYKKKKNVTPEGLEPPTLRFGILRAANCATKSFS